jgi:hypothetical protein
MFESRFDRFLGNVLLTATAFTVAFIVMMDQLEALVDNKWNTSTNKK